MIEDNEFDCADLGDSERGSEPRKDPDLGLDIEEDLGERPGAQEAAGSDDVSAQTGAIVQQPKMIAFRPKPRPGHAGRLLVDVLYEGSHGETS